jgi:KDO2-lipid IV(A) lauroyltransferase
MAPPSSPIAAWSQYLAARSGEMLLTMGDPAMRMGLASFVGRVIYRFNQKHRQRAVDHITMAFPDMSPEQVNDLAKRSFEHFTRLILEICYLPRILHPTNWADHVRLDSLGLAAQILNSGKPAIVLTGHLGNWEVLGNIMTLLGYPMHAVARPIDNPLVNDWLVTIRQRQGMQIINKKNATDQMVSVLQSGGVLGFIADQNAGDRGLFVPFFGRLASTYKSIALLAISQKVPIICGFAHRIGPRLQFNFGVEDVIEPADWANQEDPIYYVSARYVRALEKMVLRQPEQYLWMHRRWKSRPAFERKDRPMPDSLHRKLQSLPWMDQTLLRRLGQSVSELS